MHQHRPDGIMDPEQHLEWSAGVNRLIFRGRQLLAVKRISTVDIFLWLYKQVTDKCKTS